MPDFERINRDTLKIYKLTPEINNRLLKYTKIILHDDFNEPLPKLLDTITHLTLGYNYDKPLTELPISLTHLTLGFHYNHPLPKLSLTLTLALTFPLVKFAKLKPIIVTVLDDDAVTAVTGVVPTLLIICV